MPLAAGSYVPELCRYDTTKPVLRRVSHNYNGPGDALWIDLPRVLISREGYAAIRRGEWRLSTYIRLSLSVKQRVMVWLAESGYDAIGSAHLVDRALRLGYSQPFLLFVLTDDWCDNMKEQTLISRHGLAAVRKCHHGGEWFNPLLHLLGHDGRGKACRENLINEWQGSPERDALVQHQKRQAVLDGERWERLVRKSKKAVASIIRRATPRPILEAA
jgi:hypothetical protein